MRRAKENSVGVKSDDAVCGRRRRDERLVLCVQVRLISDRRRWE